MKSKTGHITPEAFYHVYNRAHGDEQLFRSEDNYYFFLRRYKKYIEPIADTFCYCLMPNHFHLLVRIKAEKELNAYFLKKKWEAMRVSQPNASFEQLTLSDHEDLKGLVLSKKLSLQFSHFFNSYTQAFNKRYQRKGGLFMLPFKRKQITDEKYLLNLIRYIHLNPVEANLCEKPENWSFSSYKSIIYSNDTFLQSKEVIQWFDDLENFVHLHGSG
jgi:REP element-mobilizing transposase RayT